MNKNENNIILEIRSGAGGEEASLFVKDLMKMYECYALENKWKFQILELSNTNVGGIKDVKVNISGTNVFSRMEMESGTHRVQRIPKTESSGRIHTSTVTVAVLIEREHENFYIREKDLRIDVYRSSGAGGQHVNTTDSAVRITHIPSGIIVTQQDERSQHKNRAKALKILQERISAIKIKEEKARNEKVRKSQIGSGNRPEKIRTYNFIRGKVTDHRLGLTINRLNQVLNGTALDEIIEALIKSRNLKKSLN